MTAAEIAGGAAVAAVAAGGTLAWAALSPGSQIFGRTLISPARPDEIALTYDDGPNPAVTPQLLEALAKHGIRATFFMIGGFVRQCPALVREVAAAGHLIGNHTMTHPWLAWQSAAKIREELYGASAAIEDVLGKPVRYFRAPHGARRPAVLRMAREMGMTPVQWNVICGDWNPIGVERILGHAVRGVERNRRRGFAANVVLHDGGQAGLGAQRMDTVGATERLIERYAGMRFVGVDAWGGT
ncbi:MAG: polysaccharide deacetylase family protein [Acidobacteria bacterium]|nr:polysaccharide deacetylase family protein [Acidobacteriota bacterium]